MHTPTLEKGVQHHERGVLKSQTSEPNPFERQEALSIFGSEFLRSEFLTLRPANMCPVHRLLMSAEEMHQH